MKMIDSLVKYACFCTTSAKLRRSVQCKGRWFLLQKI